MTVPQEAFNKVVQYSAVLQYLAECYEFFTNSGSPEKAAVLMKAIDLLGTATLNYCLEFAVREDALIPRVRFDELTDIDVMSIIKNLTHLGDSETVHELSEEAAALLSLVALETLRAERINETPVGAFNLETILGEIK